MNQPHSPFPSQTPKKTFPKVLLFIVIILIISGIIYGVYRYNKTSNATDNTQQQKHPNKKTKPNEEYNDEDIMDSELAAKFKELEKNISKMKNNVVELEQMKKESETVKQKLDDISKKPTPMNEKTSVSRQTFEQILKHILDEETSISLSDISPMLEKQIKSTQNYYTLIKKQALKTSSTVKQTFEQLSSGIDHAKTQTPNELEDVIYMTNGVVVTIISIKLSDPQEEIENKLLEYLTISNPNSEPSTIILKSGYKFITEYNNQNQKTKETHYNPDDSIELINEYNHKTGKPSKTIQYFPDGSKKSAYYNAEEKLIKLAYYNSSLYINVILEFDPQTNKLAKETYYNLDGTLSYINISDPITGKHIKTLRDTDITPQDKQQAHQLYEITFK